MTKSKRPANSQEAFARIPWAYRGRRSPLARLAQSIVPVGNKEGVPTGDLSLSMPIQDPNHEDWIMDIQGTAFQVGDGKLLTCWHVCKTLRVQERQAYYYANSRLGDQEAQRPYPVAAQFNFIDPRTDAGNPLIDVGMLISPAIHSEEAPYLVPKVTWGDSTRLGVGDRVVIGGFPLGRDLFFASATNRGLVQPSFFEGIISAIIPAIQQGESRLLQISSVSLGGISGGVVAEPSTGKVLGMVTSGLDSEGVSLPVTFAIPSEVLQPWSDSISYKTQDGRTRR